MGESCGTGCTVKSSITGANLPTLNLKVRRLEKSDKKNPGNLLYHYLTWQIWQHTDGSLVFLDTSLQPEVVVTVNKDFSQGEILIDAAAVKDPAFYPLQNLELQIFSNWLGISGDVILHASSVLHGGKSYCFVGHAGDGKSTLARNIVGRYPVMVQGEDQVILRYKADDFWVYGTPWHQDPAMCSPLGALIDKLFFLDRSLPRGVKPLSALEGVTRLLQTARVPYYQPRLVKKILDRFTLLAERVPFYSLSYPLGSDPWPMILAA